MSYLFLFILFIRFSLGIYFYIVYICQFQPPSSPYPPALLHPDNLCILYVCVFISALVGLLFCLISVLSITWPQASNRGLDHLTQVQVQSVPLNWVLCVLDNIKCSSQNSFFFFIVVDFVIHWNESAMGLHVFPILIPPPTSLSTQSL